VIFGKLSQRSGCMGIAVELTSLMSLSLRTTPGEFKKVFIAYRAEFSKHVAEYTDKWAKLIRVANIKAE